MVGQGLQDKLQRSAAGQSPARRLLVGDAIGDQLGLGRGDHPGLDLVDQIVLDAAARHRADHLTVVADRYHRPQDRKSTRLNSSHSSISYAVFCLKKKKHLLETLLLSTLSQHQNSRFFCYSL